MSNAEWLLNIFESMSDPVLVKLRSLNQSDTWRGVFEQDDLDGVFYEERLEAVMPLADELKRCVATSSPFSRSGLEIRLPAGARNTLNVSGNPWSLASDSPAGVFDAIAKARTFDASIQVETRRRALVHSPWQPTCFRLEMPGERIIR
ncbi:MAG: hypothetical protein AAF654_14465 [Myxococcota bacterium]